MKVHEALSAVMKSIGAVKKDAWNDHQKFKFRGIDDLHNACYGPLCEHGVVVLPEVVEAAYEDVKTSTGKPARQATLRVRYTFVGPEGDTLSVTSQGEAMDSADKATSKALAMAFKYALLQTFVLPTEGQDDGDSHTPERGVETPAPQPADPGRLQVVRDLFDKLPAGTTDKSLDELLAYAQQSDANAEATIGRLAKALEEVPT